MDDDSMSIANARGRFAALVGVFALAGLSLIIVPTTSIAITDHGIVTIHQHRYLAEGDPPTLRP
jgi:hypothetical protein